MSTPAATETQPAKPAPRVVEQKVKDLKTGKVSTIKVQILRGGHPAADAT